MTFLCYLMWLILTLVLPLKLSFDAYRTVGNRRQWIIYWAYYSLMICLFRLLPFLQIDLFSYVFILISVWLYDNTLRGALVVQVFLQKHIYKKEVFICTKSMLYQQFNLSPQAIPLLSIFKAPRKNDEQEIKIKKMQDSEPAKINKYYISKSIFKQKSGDSPAQISYEVVDKDKQNTLINKPQQTFEVLDQLYQENPEATLQICDRIMKEPPTNEQRVESKTIQENIAKRAEGGDSKSIILMAFVNMFKGQSQERSLTLVRHSSVKTQLSVKILTTGFMKNNVKFTEKIQQSPWEFSEIADNIEKREQFKEWFISQKAKQYGISADSIVIHRFIEGCVDVEYSVTDDASAVLNASKNNKKLKVHRYFQHFQLSEEDFFDQDGNRQFPDESSIEYRGGWPYFFPIKCKRYGLNVSKKYDRGSDDWLMMDGNPQEWAVAFHGVGSPDGSYGKTKVLNSIMSGLNKGEMLIPGGRQKYQDQYSLNQHNTLVGQGIYCSPHIQVGLDFSGYDGVNVGSDKYFLVFQCRVNPKAIKVCTNDEYWVLNKPKDIRPYGIVLVKEKVKNSYPSADRMHGKNKFTWDRYKDKIGK